jgi:hypothetical protein
MSFRQEKVQDNRPDGYWIEAFPFKVGDKSLSSSAMASAPVKRLVTSKCFSIRTIQTTRMSLLLVSLEFAKL